MGVNPGPRRFSGEEEEVVGGRKKDLWNEQLFDWVVSTKKINERKLYMRNPSSLFICIYESAIS